MIDASFVHFDIVSKINLPNDEKFSYYIFLLPCNTCVQKDQLQMLNIIDSLLTQVANCSPT